MPGLPDFGGAPVVHGETIVINDSAVISGGGGFHSTPTVLFSRPGYQVGLVLQNQAVGGGAMPVAVDMTWTDSVTSQVVAHQQWQAAAASRTNSHTIIGQGPTGGDQVAVRITNNGTAGQNLSASILVAETSVAYGEHDWRTDDGGGMLLAGFGSIASAMNDNALAAQPAVSVGAGVLDTFALPLFSGGAHLFINTASLTTDLLWNVSTIAGTVNAAAIVIAQGASDSSGNVSQDIWMPRAQCTLSVKNNNAAAKNVIAAMTVRGR